jgi:hypothetical protein
LQKDNLIAVVSFDAGDSPSVNCDVVLEADDLVGDVEDDPVEDGASKV